MRLTEFALWIALMGGMAPAPAVPTPTYPGSVKLAPVTDADRNECRTIAKEDVPSSLGADRAQRWQQASIDQCIRVTQCWPVKQQVGEEAFARCQHDLDTSRPLTASRPASAGPPPTAPRPSAPPSPAPPVARADCGGVRTEANAQAWDYPQTHPPPALGRRTPDGFERHQRDLFAYQRERVPLLEQATQAGDVWAPFQLGEIYTPEDHAKAVAAYRVAAERGNCLADIELGQYLSGLSIHGLNAPRPDLEQAIAWFRKAAADGFPGGIQMAAALARSIRERADTAALDKIVDAIVAQDSKSWMVERYVPGHVHDSRFESSSPAGDKVTMSNLEVLSGPTTRYEWVRVTFKNGRVACIEYGDSNGQCHAPGGAGGIFTFSDEMKKAFSPGPKK